jgi:hypothetical protein
MHAGLVGVIRFILKDVWIPDMAIITKARGLRRANATRLGDVVVLDFLAEGKHFVIDVVVATVYRNIVLQKVASISGYTAKKYEARKFLANKNSTELIVAIHGGPHVLVPFAVGDDGRLGAHAQSLLRALATVALEKGRRTLSAYI